MKPSDTPHSPPREEGRLRIKKISHRHLSGADGVVEPAEDFQRARPLRPLLQRRLRIFLLMSHPPLLREEGNASSRTSRTFPRMFGTLIFLFSLTLLAFAQD